jgi:oligopeptide/dipeptide ABC transporter ATP-binding protein
MLDTIPGIVPSLIDLPSGCRFAARCSARIENDLEICTQQEPQLLEISPGHEVRCWLYEQTDADADTDRSGDV